MSPKLNVSKYCYVFQMINLKFSHLFTTQGQSGSGRDRNNRGTAYLSKLQHYLSLTIRLFNVIYRTLIGAVLRLGKEVVGVFCISSRVLNMYDFEQVIISKRCNWQKKKKKLNKGRKGLINIEDCVHVSIQWFECNITDGRCRQSVKVSRD